MIVSCNCGAKLRMSDEKLTAAGVKVRCPKCGFVHVVRKPEAAPPGPAAEPGMSSFTPAAPRDRAPLVLIAHDSKVVADMIRNVIKEGGMIAEHAVDGLEALRMATDLKPQAMIVDVGLTGVYGFELCERLKSRPDTKGIKIILLSSVYGLTAYKRSPVTLYGADDYIEKHHIPDKLLPMLKRLIFGQPAGETSKTQRESPPAAGPPADVLPPEAAEEPDVMPRTPVTLGAGRQKEAEPVSVSFARQKAPQGQGIPEPKQVRAQDSVPAPAAATERHPRDLEDGSFDLNASFFEQEEYETPAGTSAAAAVDPAEVEKARRFARLIVSDIALYNQDAVGEGLRQGTFFELLQEDIAEGRSLYEKRVPEAVRATKDYYQEAFDEFIESKKKQR